MGYILGFLIALFIALTGVGAGTITVPTLVLFLGVPSAEAVGIGLMFSTAVKLIAVTPDSCSRASFWKIWPTEFFFARNTFVITRRRFTLQSLMLFMKSSGTV